MTYGGRWRSPPPLLTCDGASLFAHLHQSEGRFEIRGADLGRRRMKGPLKSPLAGGQIRVDIEWGPIQIAADQAADSNRR